MAFFKKKVTPKAPPKQLRGSMLWPYSIEVDDLGGNNVDLEPINNRLNDLTTQAANLATQITNLQNQINQQVVKLSGNQTVRGEKTFENTTRFRGSFVEFGTDIRLGYGAAVVRITPEDNTKKVLSIKNGTRWFNAIDFENVAKIRNSVDPIDPQDLATKNYVDGQITNLPSTDLTPLETKVDTNTTKITTLEGTVSANKNSIDRLIQLWDGMRQWSNIVFPYGKPEFLEPNNWSQFTLDSGTKEYWVEFKITLSNNTFIVPMGGTNGNLSPLIQLTNGDVNNITKFILRRDAINKFSIWVDKRHPFPEILSRRYEIVYVSQEQN